MTEQSFAVPGSSYKELIKIIQGYAQVGKEAVPSEVGSLIGIHETQVSRSNKFLVAVGIVQGGKKKKITQLGMELARALQHDMSDEIAKKWREIAEANDFLQKVVASVRIRKGMDESSLEAHVAYSAGQPKTPPVMAGAGTTVEILKLSGLLREEGGNLVAAPIAESRQEQKQIAPEIPTAQIAPPRPPSPISTAGIAISPDLASSSINVNIQIRVSCTPDDLDVVGPKLRHLLDELAASGKVKQDESSSDDELGQD
jgi:hypothetical protein